MSLKIAHGITLPVAAVTEAIGFLGRRGSGKTYAAQKLAEEFHRAGAQFVVLDPVGNWWALRLAADGKSQGIPIPVFGGLHGDVPLEATAGKLIADVVVDRGISAVIDVSQFESDAAKARFAADFGDRFYFRKKSAPSAVHVILEESQEFIPQNPQGDEAKMLHAWTRIAKLGRNYGIGISMLSQRPQEVNKKVLNLTELLFCFQLTGPQERKTVDGWIRDKGLDEDIAGELPKLKRGEPHAWSPSWLEISEVVKIAPKWTYDASSTPKVGAKSAEPKPLAPIDLERIRSDMAATIEKARADDPVALRKRIAELERAVKGGVARTVEKPVVDQAAIDRAVAAVRREYERQSAEMAKVVQRIVADAAKLAPFAERLSSVTVPPVTVARSNGHAPKVVPRAAPRPVSSAPASGLTQRLLDALAEFAQMGESAPERESLAVFVGTSSKGGYFNNTLGKMRTEGLIDYPSDGRVSLTDEGTARANPPESPTSLDGLHNRWRGKLGGLDLRIFEAVVEAYPNALTRAELADAVGTNAGGGYFNNTVGKLRTLRIVDYPQTGTVAAHPALFPDGLT